MMFHFVHIVAQFGETFPLFSMVEKILLVNKMVIGAGVVISFLALVLSVDVRRVHTLHFTSLTPKGSGCLPSVLICIHSEFDWTMEPSQKLSSMGWNKIFVWVCDAAVVYISSALRW
jgi:hypothetical protein